MFPLRDTIRSHSFPWVNWGLILLNVLVFLFQSSLPPAAADRLLLTYGLVPARLSLLNPLPWATLLSSIFLHGGWFHLISNLWTLYIFGDNVEDRMGSFTYLVFYLAAGVTAGLAHALLSFGSPLPTVGASGAIAGVLGAYFVLFPHGRVITFVPWFFLPWFVEIPAFVFLGIWFVSQLSSGLLELGAAAAFSGIAWWAHIGGFAFGLLLALPFRQPRRPQAVWYRDEYWPW